MRHRNDRSVTKLGPAALLVAAAGGILAAAPASAQRDRGLEVDVADCVEIEAPAERFRCYESRVDAALGEQDGRGARDETPAADPPDAERADERAAGRAAEGRSVTPEREIDVVGSSATEDERSRSNDDEDERQEFFGTVASLRETLPNTFVITLENGQVWRQMRPTFYPLRPGHRVRIYATNWGDSYRMSSEELRGFIQVERIR